MFRPIRGPLLASRLVRLAVGLSSFGVGIGLMVESGLGNAPWTVFHQGLSVVFGLTIGAWTVIVSMCVLLLWIPLRERYGLGTVANALLVGPSIDLTTVVVPAPSGVWLQAALLAAGILVVGLASGLYIGAHLGPGPRDGLMTAISRRGPSIRLTRFGIEASVLVVGWLLGGTVGVGTIAFALAIGPLVQIFLNRLSVGGGSLDRAASVARKGG